MRSRLSIRFRQKKTPVPVAGRDQEFMTCHGLAGTLDAIAYDLFSVCLGQVPNAEIGKRRIACDMADGAN